MTITDTALSGTYEHLDKVIAYNLELRWNNANTNSEPPVFYSATGSNVTQSWPLTDYTNEVHCNEADPMPDPNETDNGDRRHKLKTIVYVDVFARDANLLKLYIREVDRIIWEYAPNDSTRINKSDTAASNIIRYENSSLEWHTEFIKESNTQRGAHASGKLICIHYRIKT